MSDENNKQVLNPEVLKKLITYILREEKDGLLFKRPDIEIIQRIQDLIYRCANKDIKDINARGDKL